jgi:sugar (pentulose or hexulose) kinase
LWRQIVADVFDLPVRPLATREQAAIGAALLAGAGLGDLDPAAEARVWAKYDNQVEPKSDASQIYRGLLGIFRAAYVKHRVDFVDLWQM